MGAAKVAETPEAAKVAAGITVEAANEPEVNVEAVVERLQRDIFESEEAGKIDPKQEQLINGFPETKKPDFTKMISYGSKMWIQKSLGLYIPDMT